MLTISVCLETLFTNLSVEQRIAKIAEAGYNCVEFWHPEGTYDGKCGRADWAKNAATMKRACDDHGMTISVFGVIGWDGNPGGTAVKAEDHPRCCEQLRKMMDFAAGIDCHKGVIHTGCVDPKLSRSEMRKNLEKLLEQAIKIAEKADFVLMMEPLNLLVDHAGYYLGTATEAFEIAKQFNSPNLRVLFDIYHMQITQGNLLATIEKNIDWISHFHAAAVPGRAELFGGELDYQTIFAKIESFGYKGAFGLEYFPKMSDHSESLRKTLKYLSSKPIF